ncbi:ABC transporter permease [Prauserella flavalba]|uniref:ABC transporter permease n=1 Tax=Prauserella flavalba TaxID=1477506 RepID=UPI000D7556E2|nr:ABC transporter permease [Prauserella flavalba]
MPLTKDYISGSRRTSADDEPGVRPTRKYQKAPVWRFVARRIVTAPIVLFGVILLVFLIVDLSPNDPARASLGLFASEEARERFAAANGLDDPVWVRFWRFIVNLLHLDLGSSVVRPEPVAHLIGAAFPVTLQLMLLATVIAVFLSLLLGVLAAQTDGRLVDRTIGGLAALFQAAPPFWVGLMFIQLFAVALGVLPSGGYFPIGDGVRYWFSSIIGPATVLALPFTAAMTRIVRASVADELAKDYVRTAKGAGIPWSTIMVRNVLRNSLISPVTVLGLYIGGLMSGAIVVESVFNLPGMGTLLVSGADQGDLGVVRGVAIVSAFVFVLVNLVVDLFYILLNPRAAEAGAE